VRAAAAAAAAAGGFGGTGAAALQWQHLNGLHEGGIVRTVAAGDDDCLRASPP